MRNSIFFFLKGLFLDELLLGKKGKRHKEWHDKVKPEV